MVITYKMYGKDINDEITLTLRLEEQASDLAATLMVTVDDVILSDKSVEDFTSLLIFPFVAQPED